MKNMNGNERSNGHRSKRQPYVVRTVETDGSFDASSALHFVDEIIICLRLLQPGAKLPNSGGVLRRF